MLRTHRIVVASAAIIALVLLQGCGGAEARRASHMQRGNEYFAQENFDKARVEFRNALQIAPNDAEARFMSGRTAEKLGNVRDAAGMYQAAVDVDPEHVRARANLGRLMVFAGGPKRALEIVEPALVKHPDDADLLTVRGAARIQMEDRAGAVQDAERAVQLAPDNENAVALLASLHRQGGERGKAIELVESTLDRVPASIDLRQVLASLYLEVEEPALAGAQLRKIVEQKPKELSYRMHLAIHYARNKQADQAERVLQDAMRALPESDAAKLAYVDFVSAQRSFEKGEATLKEFIARDADDYELQLGLGGLQQRRGAVDEALKTYASVVERDREGPSGLAARTRMAAIHAGRGKLDDAARLIDETLKNNPRDNDALVLRGNLALQRNDAAAAIADLRAVLRDQPGAVGVLRTLARAHLQNGEPELAEENIRAALAANPADSTVRIELAQLLAQTQRAPQAVALLEEAVNAAPTHIPAREALARAYLSVKDYPAARNAIENLKIAAPNEAVGFYLGGVLAQAQKRPEEAETNLNRALELQPKAMDALAALARLEVERGRMPKAIERVSAAVQAEPGNAVARNLLGELLLAARDYRQAIAELSVATQSAPRWWLAHRNLALAKISAGDMPGAIAAYQAGIKATDYEPLLVTDLAALHEQQGRIDDAIREYEALYQHKPRLQLAANNLAMLLVTYRQDAASLDRARALTNNFGNSDQGALLDTHAWVLFKLGEHAQALTVLERAVERSPDSKMIRYHLAMAQLKNGQRDKARDNLESALNGAANFAGSDEARTVLAELAAAPRSG